MTLDPPDTDLLHLALTEWVAEAEWSRFLDLLKHNDTLFPFTEPRPTISCALCHQKIYLDDAMSYSLCASPYTCVQARSSWGEPWDGVDSHCSEVYHLTCLADAYHPCSTILTQATNDTEEPTILPLAGQCPGCVKARGTSAEEGSWAYVVRGMFRRKERMERELAPPGAPTPKRQSPKRRQQRASPENGPNEEDDSEDSFHAPLPDRGISDKGFFIQPLAFSRVPIQSDNSISSSALSSKDLETLTVGNDAGDMFVTRCQQAVATSSADPSTTNDVTSTPRVQPVSPKRPTTINLFAPDVRIPAEHTSSSERTTRPFGTTSLLDALDSIDLQPTPARTTEKSSQKETTRQSLQSARKTVAPPKPPSIAPTKRPKAKLQVLSNSSSDDLGKRSMSPTRQTFPSLSLHRGSSHRRTPSSVVNLASSDDD